MKAAIRVIYYFFKNIFLNATLNNINIALTSKIAHGTTLSENTKIGKRSYFKGKIGEFSYIGENCRINADIGKFCSISPGVKVINATHPIEFISTSPVFYSTSRQCGYTFVKKPIFDDLLYFDKVDKIACKIGNDVWIGENVMLMGGVVIGDGAVIAMGAIVTKDVPPYSIYAGIPAKIIRKRFNEDEISLLLKMKWWDNSKEWLIGNKDLFVAPNNFFNKFK